MKILRLMKTLRDHVRITGWIRSKHRREPGGPSYTDLAASIVAYMTAWHMLKTKVQVRPGKTVLVVGAGSGASAAVRLAKALGATVIATTSTERKERQVRALGADEVINYREQPDFREPVRALTGGLGADVVHETVGSILIYV